MRPTTQTTQEIRHTLDEGLQLLRRLRDEIRLELHLGGMEAKEQWKQLEPRFDQAERLSHEVTEASRRAVDKTVEAFKAFRATLRKPNA